MPINVTGPRTHLRAVELPGGEVKAEKTLTVRDLRDHDRRIYRFWVITLGVAQVVLAGGFRYLADIAMVKAANNPRFEYLVGMKPYILPTMICLVVLMWTVGIWFTFRRRYR